MSRTTFKRQNGYPKSLEYCVAFVLPEKSTGKKPAKPVLSFLGLILISVCPQAVNFCSVLTHPCHQAYSGLRDQLAFCKLIKEQGINGRMQIESGVIRNQAALADKRMAWAFQFRQVYADCQGEFKKGKPGNRFPAIGKLLSS